MRRMPVVVAALAVGLIASAPAAAKVRIAENDSVPLVSGNVTPLATIPISTCRSARASATSTCTSAARRG